MKKEYIIIGILIVIIGLSFIDLKGKKIDVYENGNITHTLYLDKREGILTRVIKDDGQVSAIYEYHLISKQDGEDKINYNFGDIDIEYNKLTREYSRD